MCGIAGIFGLEPGRRPEALLHRMLDRIEHRGPDGRGVALFPHAALGHVRLAIIDLEGGGQPMTAPETGVTVVFNGEIYNFREIRAGLEKQGVVFSTDSDTEVLLRAYLHQGEEAFPRFRGMFACAFWDSRTRQGLLVRDRFGIKPLFYHIDAGGRLIFSSEIKGLLPALASTPAPDLAALHLLMNFRYVPGQQTLFSGVSQLRPGCCLRWRDGEASVHAWLGDSGGGRRPHDLEAVRAAMKTAVGRQLVSDVPLGGYLSGGLDSSTILALSLPEMRAADRRYPTFTIKTGDSPDEAARAAATAAHFGVPNFQRDMPVNLAASLPSLIYHLEVPKVNALQAAEVAGLAAGHVKVALSGLGGDEIFLGYTIHRLLAGLEPWKKAPGRYVCRLAGGLASVFFATLGQRFDEWRRAGTVLRRMPDMAHAYGVLRNVWDSPEARKMIYGPVMRAARPADAHEWLRRAWPAREDAVAAAACFEIREKMVNDLLLQEDRLSMAFGLEVRVPFLDEDLVDLITAIDRDARMRDRQPKSLMKRAAAAWLPPSILQRPKSGFQVPIHRFFHTHLMPLCAELLCRQRLETDGLFNPDFVEAVLRQRPHPRLRWHYFMLYLMIGVNLWFDIFQNGARMDSRLRLERRPPMCRAE